MPIGTFVRRLLSPLEKPISDIYRNIFIDLADLTHQIHKWVNPEIILELGCGEGALTELLASAYPSSHIIGIDITPRVGRMFQGNLDHVRFEQKSIQEFVAETPQSVDLVVISDVMHHVPWSMHEEFLTYAGKSLKPNGYIVLKDWRKNNSPIHYLCYLFERYITGDKVKYKTTKQFRDMIYKLFGKQSIILESTVRPWKNNIVFLIKISS